MSFTKPSFDDLPLREGGPPRNAWGLFGDEDECGMLNLLTPSTVAAAASEIEDGVRVSTDWPLDAMARPCFGRPAFEHKLSHKAPHNVNDDILTFNTQSSSQWDGFRHFGVQTGEKIYFNGRTLDQILNSRVNGVDAWVEKGGIVGRGVLLDYATWAESKGIAVSHFTTSSIPVSCLQEIAKSQNVTFRQGDILLIRTGWIREYEKLSDSKCQELAALRPPGSIGVESSEATLRWIWDEGFAAVAGDQLTMEAWPCQDMDFYLHEWLLSGWGVPIGELFNLEELSRECLKRKRWTFFFSSMPLKVPGGVASPPNGYAIF